MDEIMSNEKTTSSKPEKTPVRPAVRGYGVVAGAKPPAPEVVNLEFDESDSGSDPYNHTGSHCVLDFTDD